MVKIPNVLYFASFPMFGFCGGQLAKALTWEMAPRTCNAKVAPKADSAAGGIWSKMKASLQRCIQWGNGGEMDGNS